MDVGEKTKSEKAAEYIERKKAKSLLHIEYAYAAEQLLDEIPTADVAPVIHGRWIDPPLYGNKNCICSECGRLISIQSSWRGEIMQKYCPNCGAKMDGGED